jgi:hypothetical protein
MILTFLLARLKRSRRFVWSPALDLENREIFSALIPGVQY